MTKAEIVTSISDKLGMERGEVQAVLELFMKEVKDSLEHGESVYLRGFGSFVVKKRKSKTARNILKNTAMILPAYCAPAFKPSKGFVERIKSKVDVETFVEKKNLNK